MTQLHPCERPVDDRGYFEETGLIRMHFFRCHKNRHTQQAGAKTCCRRPRSTRGKQQQAHPQDNKVL